MVHSISSDLTALMLTAVFTLGSTLNLNRTDLWYFDKLQYVSVLFHWKIICQPHVEVLASLTAMILFLYYIKSVHLFHGHSLVLWTKWSKKFFLKKYILARKFCHKYSVIRIVTLLIWFCQYKLRKNLILLSIKNRKWLHFVRGSSRLCQGSAQFQWNN